MQANSRLVTTRSTSFGDCRETASLRNTMPAYMQHIDACVISAKAAGTDAGPQKTHARNSRRRPLPPARVRCTSIYASGAQRSSVGTATPARARAPLTLLRCQRVHLRAQMP